MDFAEFLKSVGDNIKGRRKRLGLTQKEMVIHGLAQRHIQDIESGNANLTLKTLWRLAEVFKVQVADLLGRTKPVSVCSYQDGIVERIIPFMPMACIIWKYHFEADKEATFRLKSCNDRAEEITFRGLGANTGRDLLDLFPATEALGFVKLLNVTLKSNKAMRLTDFLYSDSKVAFGNFWVTAVPICHGEIAVFFDTKNESMLLRQLHGGSNILKHEMEEIGN